MNDGGAAFPPSYNLTGDLRDMRGMSLRDYFAAKAMQAFIPLGVDGTVDDFDTKEIAHESYRYADAMLEARDR